VAGERIAMAEKEFRIWDRPRHKRGAVTARCDSLQAASMPRRTRAREGATAAAREREQVAAEARGWRGQLVFYRLLG
jgi:hypothetical protein